MRRLSVGACRAAGALATCALGLAASAAPTQALTVHVQRALNPHGGVRLTFAAPRLAGGGYYYALLVLRHYRHYTRTTPPPCAVSSDMLHTDYGYPDASGTVVLRATAGRSQAGEWCRGGVYEAGIYAVPHQSPCEAQYPCESEPYEVPTCLGHINGKCVEGVVARQEWIYPAPLPVRRTLFARFRVVFPSR